MNEETTKRQDSPEEEQEMTLRDLVAKVIDIYRMLRAQWKLVLLSVSLFSGTFLLIALLTPPKYPAQLTFMVREDSKNGLSSVANLLGQFGFGSGSSGDLNLDKITELAKSRHILQAALFDSATIQEKSDYLANHIIETYNFHRKWSDDKLLRDFRFAHGNVEQFDRRENKALKHLHQYMVGEKTAFVKAGYSKQTSILNITAYARREDLSIALVESLYRHLSQFYIEQSTAQSRQTVRNLELRRDSIRAVLTTAETTLARTEDRTLGLLLKEDKVPQKRLGTDIQILNLMYAEAIKNLETASFLLKNATPVFMEIDRPLAPIKPVNASKKVALALGLGIGLLIAIIYIVGMQMFKNVDIKSRDEKRGTS